MGDKENQRLMNEGKRVCFECHKEFVLEENLNKDIRKGGYKCPHCGKILNFTFD